MVAGRLEFVLQSGAFSRGATRHGKMVMNKRFIVFSILGLTAALFLLELDLVMGRGAPILSAAQITPANSLTVIPPTSAVTPTPSITPTASPTNTPTPTLTPFPTEHLVFVYVSDRGNGEKAVYLRDLATGEERQISDNLSLVDAPALSPNREWVVYETQYSEAYLVMARVGQAPDYNYPLTLEIIDFLEYSDWGPVWSPDGTHIAFHSDRNGNLDIFILDPETYEIVQVTTSEEADAYAAWSPDGTQLVYQCTINEGREVCIIDVTGENLVQLTENERFDGLPDWSPDGTQIVFASTRDEEKEELYVMQADGSNVRRLTELPNSIDTDPKWSPDGETILFESDAGVGGDFEICLIGADGTGLECLTDNDIPDRSPDW